MDEENRAERSRGSGVTKRTRHLGGRRGGNKAGGGAKEREGGRAKRVSGAAGHLVCLCTHTPPPALLAAAGVRGCSLPFASRHDKHMLFTSGTTTNRIVCVLRCKREAVRLRMDRRFTDGGSLRHVPRAVAHISH